jgi:RHS repeat-associated protein
VKNLNHQYHISGAVKSAVAYVSEGSGTNQLEKVMGSMSIDDSGNKRDMSADNNFLYDRDGNMIEDKSKEMTISYDHRGLPVEFKREVPSISGVAGEKDSVRLTLAYDGAGSRITKKRERKVSGGEWTTELATHYTGIGSEIREDAINNATKVVVNLPQGLGRYDIASASESSTNDNAANSVPSFEWYLKNHLGSTMLVYGTQSISDPTISNLGFLKAAYDYRAFGEQVDLTRYTDKVTETFTGKEKDDETELSYFGARYLDQMLGLWVSVDTKRQHYSPYEYGSNNPIVRIDPDGNADMLGVANTGIHVVGGVSLMGLGVSICSSVAGCALGIPLLGIGAADLLTVPFNIAMDAKEQTWPSETVVEKLPVGVQDVINLAEKFGTGKSILDKDFLSVGFDVAEEIVNSLINSESPIPLLSIEGMAPSDNTSVFDPRKK